MLPPLNSILFYCDQHGVHLVVYYFYAPAIPATFHLPAVGELVELDHAVSLSGADLTALMDEHSSEIIRAILSRAKP